MCDDQSVSRRQLNMLPRARLAVDRNTSTLTLAPASLQRQVVSAPVRKTRRFVRTIYYTLSLIWSRMSRT